MAQGVGVRFWLAIPFVWIGGGSLRIAFLIGGPLVKQTVLRAFQGLAP
jgi:hypothetical protein